MTIKTLLATSAILAFGATASLAEGCNWSKQQASMSCATGTVYDADTGSCKAVTG